MQNLAKERIKDFQRFLKQCDLDGYICLSQIENQYFSGLELWAEEAVFLITQRKAYCFTYAMITPLLSTVTDFIVIKEIKGDMLAAALEWAVKTKMMRLAFDPTMADFERGEKLAQAGLSRLHGVVSEMRKAKYPDEAACVAKACQIAADAFNEIKPYIKTGVTEGEITSKLSAAMIAKGADTVAFNMVCFGEHSARPHHRDPLGKRKLKNNEAVLIDFGCFYRGYCSDMTRSWWHGKKEPAEYAKIWHIVHMAKEAASGLLKAGVPAAEIDKTARSIIEDAGYGKYFIHSTGHGIGLSVHEGPALRSASVDILEENFVVTVEPGIYLPGKYGVRLEDSYLVTATGTKNLTKN